MSVSCKPHNSLSRCEPQILNLAMTLMDGKSLQSTSLIQLSEFLTSQGHQHEMEQSITDSQAPKARKEAM
jgi:hypothetical protein